MPPVHPILNLNLPLAHLHLEDFRPNTHQRVLNSSAVKGNSLVRTKSNMSAKPEPRQEKSLKEKFESKWDHLLITEPKPLGRSRDTLFMVNYGCRDKMASSGVGISSVPLSVGSLS